ncbi:MAG: alpha/beta fold hydrolase [Anaerolineales bacterium]|nr:alpha/beta fold hydrolase [Anaerolineales bacterium]
MHHIEFELKSEDGLKFYAQGWQPDDKAKAVVCLIHGLGEHSGRYEHVGDYLNKNAYALLAFDLRGHGKSEGQRGHSPSYEAFYSDFDIFLKEVETQNHGLPLFLYGHSLGGNLVINYDLAKLPQVHGLIVTGPAFRPGFEPPPAKISLGKMMRKIWPTFSMNNEIDREALSKDPEVVRAYNEDPLVHDRLSAQLGIDLLEYGVSALERADELQHDLLLMQGGDDRLCSVQASSEFARKATERCDLKIWDGLYHEVHNEPEKEQVLSYMVNWLNGKL